MVEFLWACTLVAVLFVILLKVVPIKRVTVFQYERGLKYTKGRFVRTLDAGQYWYFPIRTKILTVDMRSVFVTIPGQELLSADGVALKVSAAAEFQVADPATVINRFAEYRTALYLLLQMAVREVVAKEKVESLLENRAGVGNQILQTAATRVSELGLKLISADIKDLMVPGDMKRAYTQVLIAQKEGQAALERARGETAALRSLANAARMMDDNPNLLQLRALQALEKSTGNTLVLGMPDARFIAKKSDELSKPEQQA